MVNYKRRDAERSVDAFPYVDLSRSLRRWPGSRNRCGELHAASDIHTELHTATQYNIHWMYREVSSYILQFVHRVDVLHICGYGCTNYIIHTQNAERSLYSQDTIKQPGTWAAPSAPTGRSSWCTVKRPLTVVHDVITRASHPCTPR